MISYVIVGNVRRVTVEDKIPNEANRLGFYEVLKNLLFHKSY
jgi:hypothetical protein